MRRECDGQQEVLFYYFDIEDVVRDLVADKMALGKQHLSFRADIGPDGRRRFTDAHTGLAFEHAAREIGDGVVPYSLVIYIDGTSQWRNISVWPIYITTRNNDKSIQSRPSSWRLLGVLPILRKSVGTLDSKDERTYRRKKGDAFVHICPIMST